MNKFASLALISFIGLNSVNTFSAEPENLNILELASADYPGGSYDEKIEMQKKVSRLENLQMTPEQMRSIKEMLLTQKRSASTPYPTTAIPVTRSLGVKFESGLTPPIIRLSANMLTTIVFTDGAGNPWNIESVALNRQLFSDGADVKSGISNTENNDSGEKPTNLVRNILSIEPLNPVAYGNVIVTLEGFDKPVILMLATGQQEVDMRVDARISGINPNRIKKSNFNPNMSTTMDEAVLLFVDGTPPEDVERMKVSSNSISAWRFNDELVVRTNKTIIYPAYKSSVTSSSGISVYRFDVENQSVTISDMNGQPSTIYIEQE